jgi:hypothetical protein
MERQVCYQRGGREYQLELFACEWVSWETLPMDIHAAAIEIISQLLEQALSWEEFATTEEKEDV